MSLEIDCPAVKAKLDAGEDVLLLDCREEDEVQRVRIEGSLWIPMSELPARHLELEPHRHREIIVYCHLGGRSLNVAHWLVQQGIPSVLSMAGGIDQWAELMDPGLPRY